VLENVLYIDSSMIFVIFLNQKFAVRLFVILPNSTDVRSLVFRGAGWEVLFRVPATSEFAFASWIRGVSWQESLSRKLEVPF
jgi:hypothetical protein